MMGKETSKSNVNVSGDTYSYANELNEFYARFDVNDFRHECDVICNPIVPQHIEVSEEEVVKTFSKLNAHKACGPDQVKGKVLKSCATQLGGIFTTVFQMLLNCHIMPRFWKTSTIIPVPKKPNASQLNDFRPIALTSILAKCMERIVLNRLLSDVSERLDPLQFAYKARRGAEDASLLLYNLIASHLEDSGAYVRILFIDFSSAFNTIEPHLLLKRLLDLNVT